MYKYFLCFTYVKLILIKFCLAVKCLIKVCKNVSRTQPNDLSQTADFEKQLPIPTKPWSTTLLSPPTMLKFQLIHSCILHERTSFKYFFSYLFQPFGP